MKDLPFYEVSHLADNEAKQAHLDTREKKRQKETLRQAPGSTSRVASNPIPDQERKRLLFGLKFRRP